MNNAKKQKVVIIGAGLVGLLLALYLSKRDEYEIEIYEKGTGDLREDKQHFRSINLSLTVRGLAALQGFSPALRESVERASVSVWKRTVYEKDEATTMPYGDPKTPFLLIERFDLMGLLSEAVRSIASITIFYNSICKSIADDFHSAVVSLDGGDVSVPFTYLMGVDGVHSQVRKELARLGDVNEGMVTSEYQYKACTIPVAFSLKHELQENSTLIWPGEGRFLTALPNRDRSFNCLLFLPRSGPQSFGELESSNTKRMEGFLASAFPAVRDLAHEWSLAYHHSLAWDVHEVSCGPWAYKNVFLVGDAAHAVFPFHGQGANAGLEDCALLYKKLESARGLSPELFTAFYQERKQDTDAINFLTREHLSQLDSNAIDPHRWRNEINLRLAKRFAGEWLSMFEAIYASQMPYKEIMEREQRQQLILETVSHALLGNETIDQIEDQCVDAVTGLLQNGI